MQRDHAEDDDLLTCPNCGVKSPKTLYCVNCGYPLTSEKPKNSILTIMEQDKITDETIEQEPVVLIESVDPTHDVTQVDKADFEGGLETKIAREQPLLQVVGSSHSIKSGSIKDVMEDLAKSFSMNLWLVDLLQRGEVKEEHFNKLFERYESRLKQSITRRKEMLDKARKMDALEKALNAAKIGLAELEMRKSIGDVSEGEYDAKEPAFKWDISHYEEEISKRNDEISHLEDITRVISKEEASRMKQMAEGGLKAIDELEKSGKFSSNTAAKVKSSLEETLTYLEGF